MNAQEPYPVVGVFADGLHANRAISELHEAGFTEARIGAAMRNAEGIGGAAGAGPDSPAASGALTGLGLGSAPVSLA